VADEDVDIGQYVAPGISLAMLYATEAAEIVIPLENAKLHWFHVPGFTSTGDTGSPATVHARIAGEAITWPGRVVRSQGQVDERTRMIRVVVEVKNPYSRRPPLVPGLFVTVDIAGKALSEAVVIPRSALHEGDTVWVVDDEARLRFRKVDVAIIQGTQAVVRSGLATGEDLVLTPLKTVTDGMMVRIVPPPEAPKESPAS
jgi:RND family efflux transporter MFP subunit